MSLRKLSILIIFECLIWAVPTRADVVTDWNDYASQTALVLAVPPRPGPSAILDFAMVHAAMHDAIQAYDRRFEPYAVSIPNATGSPIAAAASARRPCLLLDSLDRRETSIRFSTTTLVAAASWAILE